MISAGSDFFGFAKIRGRSRWRSRWRESCLPVSVLAHQMIGAGITDLTNERSIEAARELLPERVSDIEEAAPRRAN